MMARFHGERASLVHGSQEAESKTGKVQGKIHLSKIAPETYFLQPCPTLQLWHHSVLEPCFQSSSALNHLLCQSYYYLSSSTITLIEIPRSALPTS